MKRILITGANSYIGTSFEKYIVENYSNDFLVETLDMIDSSWRQYDFSKYDVVFHVAGIAHADSGRISVQKEKLYRSVNTDLVVETAKKAKVSGVKQFIFMSSIIVYGSKNECVNKDTIPEPDNCYGDSKLQADIKIAKLQSECFNVVSIRPPMIYGKNSKGNFPKLVKLAQMTPIFPDYKNRRSMLYIDNLCEFVRLLILNEEKGIFYPQNSEYINTIQLVKEINPNIKTTSVFNFVIRILKNVSVVKKIFGNFYYDYELSSYKDNYIVFNNKKSIERTINNDKL